MVTKLSRVAGFVLLAACTGTARPPVVAPRSLDPSACALDAYAPASVHPYYDAQITKAALRRVLGAEIFIAARPGLTAEWLRAELAPRATGTGCALGVPGAQVAVDSDGPGFRVTIRASNAVAGHEILELSRVVEPRQ